MPPIQISDPVKDVAKINSAFQQLDALYTRLAAAEKQINYVQTTSQQHQQLAEITGINDLTFTWTGSTSTISWNAGSVLNRQGNYVPIPAGSITGLSASTTYWLAWNSVHAVMAHSTTLAGIQPNKNNLVICNVTTLGAGSSGAIGGGGTEDGGSGFNRTIYATTGGGSGTVTSIGIAVPTGFQLSGSPVTTSGTITIAMPVGWTTGDLLIGDGSNSVTRVAIGTSTYVLTSDGTTASWSAVPITSSRNMWQYKAKTSATSGYPGDGFILWDNATQTSATHVIIAHITDDNLDIDLILGYMSSGDTLVIQDAGASANFQTWTISGSPVNTGLGTSTSYWTVPVTLSTSGGTGTTGFAGNTKLILFHIMTGGGSGTVTSVALSMPAEFSVSGSPITTAGTITVSKANESANLVYAGPSTGAAAAPTFRSLVNADLPTSGVTAGSYTSTNLTVNAQGIITAASNGSSSGGGLISYITPSSLTPPSVGAWTWANQGATSTATNAGGALWLFNTSGTGSIDISGKYTAAPVSTPYSVIVGFVSAWQHTNTNANAGIFLYESGTGKVFAWGRVEFSNNYYVQTSLWSSFTSRSSAPLSTTVQLSTPIIWLKVTNDGTNLISYLGADGQNWVQEETRTVASAFTTAPDNVGLFVAHGWGGALFLHWSAA